MMNVERKFLASSFYIPCFLFEILRTRGFIFITALCSLWFFVFFVLLILEHKDHKEPQRAQRFL